MREDSDIAHCIIAPNALEGLKEIICNLVCLPRRVSPLKRHVTSNLMRVLLQNAKTSIMNPLKRAVYWIALHAGTQAVIWKMLW